MEQSVYVTRDQVAPIIQATFPDYNGKKLRVQPAKTVTFTELNWDGGSRSQYSASTLNGEGLGSLAKWNAKAPWCNAAEGATVDLPRGAVIVCHSIFCGSDTGLTIYIHPEDMPKSLTTMVELTDLELLILIATRSYKSSYMGKDRYQMARDDWERDQVFKGNKFGVFCTRLEWEAAKTGLITRKLLNKAGAITNAGRNAL